MAGLPTSSRTYTLAQVRAAGLPAWKEDYLFVERRVYRIVAFPEPGGGNRVHIRPSDLEESSPLLRDGWMHMPISAGEVKRGQRPLTIEEVREAGTPAVFSAHGDHLAYADDTVYALLREPDPCDLADLPHLPGAYEVTNDAGIEYGWYHLEARTVAPDGKAPREAA
jgi:hypothetical protein